MRPMGLKAPSRASSLSSAGGSAALLPYMQAQVQQRSSLPAKVQSQTQPRVAQSPTLQARAQGSVATKPVSSVIQV